MSSKRVRKQVPEDGSERRTYAGFALAAVLWLGLGAWVFYMVDSANNYSRHYFERLEKLNSLPIYHPGEVVRYDEQTKLTWIGWSGPEPGFRWSADKSQVGLVFRTAAGDNWKCPCELKFHVLYTRGMQHVTLLIHGRTIGTSTITGPGTLVFEIPPGVIEPNSPESAEFHFPDAGPPKAEGDNRVLGIAITDFIINSSGS